MRSLSFPTPIRVSPGCTRWPLSRLLEYEAACGAVAVPELMPSQERYLSVRQVAERLGISVASVWRRSAASHRETSQ
jgi:predicted DNA-binding transcriptional regulator AlpA